MFTDNTLYAAMKLQERALKTAAKPGGYEIGMRAWMDAQRIIDQWDRRCIDVMKEKLYGR